MRRHHHQGNLKDKAFNFVFAIIFRGLVPDHHGESRQEARHGAQAVGKSLDLICNLKR